MRKILITLLMLPLLILPVKATTDWTAIVEKIANSLVYIDNPEGSCTGFVIDAERHYVLTAAHCDNEEGKVWVDRVTSKIISKDSLKDLAVFEVKDLDPDRPALELAETDPKRGQDVMSAGYGMALERPIFRKAMIADNSIHIPVAGLGGPFVGIDAPFVGGQSGGPVVDQNGKVVMIVQRASDTTGIGVGAKLIRERVGRFFAKAKP